MKRRIVAVFLAALVLLASTPLTSIAQEFENPFVGEDALRQQVISLSQKPAKPQNTAENSNIGTKSFLTESVQDSYVVQFKQTASLQTVYQCVSNYTYQLLADSGSRLFKMEIGDPEAFQRDYGQIVDYAAKSKNRVLSAVPNDYYYSNQWAIPSIKLPAAWDKTKGSADIKVAVIDSGFYRNHEDMSNSAVLAGVNVVTGIPNVTSDEVGHGTMVTSIIAATTNNSKGIAGGCWNVSVIPYKVAKSDGSLSSADIISAIRMAADAGCDVINLSLGGYEVDPAEQAAVDYAVGKGCIIVAAAGNEGESTDPDHGKLSYPASCNGVISVASIDRYNRRSVFSQYNNKVDVCAPGEDIIAAYKTSYNSYVSASGTSFSSPYVATVAALARSLDKTITASSFEQVIKETSADLGTASRDDYYGWGRIDAQKIMEKLAYPVITGVENNGVYSSAVTITFDRGTATLDGNAFSSGGTASGDGYHTLIVTDNRGRKTTVNFAIDSGSLTVSGIVDGGFYRSATITYSRGTATLNGASFSSGTTVSTEGGYTLVLTGPYGRTETFRFTIDRTPPVVIGVFNGKSYDLPVTLRFNEGTGQLNGKAIISEYKVSVKGSYTLVVTDAAGNVTTVQFEMTKTFEGNLELVMQDSLTQWLLDESGNQLFAIAESGKLLCIDTVTMNIDKSIELGGIPTDIIADRGKVYIALDAKKQIVVVDIATTAIEKTISTTTDPYRIAKDGNKLYYVEYDRRCELHELNLDTNQDTNMNIGSISDPDIAVNPDLHLLYLGESGLSGSDMTYYSITEKRIVSKTTYDGGHGYAFPNRVTLYNGNNVFYAGRAFSPESAADIRGDYGGSKTVLFAKFGCVFTSSAVYEEDTHIKAGDFKQSIDLAEASESGSVFLYQKSNKKIIKATSTSGTLDAATIISLVDGVPAAEVPQETDSVSVSENKLGLSMKSELTQWVLDDANNLLYAISTKDKALFFIDSKTLCIEKTLRFPSAPTDIVMGGGKLYLSLADANRIMVVDIETRAVSDAMITTSDPYRLALDGEKLYYTEWDQWCYVYEYNLTTRTDKKIDDRLLYQPELFMNTKDHILYIGESSISSGTITYYSTTENIILDESAQMSNIFRNLAFDGKYVYYCGVVLDPRDPSIIIHTFPDRAAVLNAKYGFVFTPSSMYYYDNESDFEKRDSYGTSLSLVELSDSLDLFTYDKSSQMIYRDDRFLPQVTGVEDGRGYLEPVTIKFGRGTALLDGEPFESGGVVFTSGEHTLAVTFQNREERVIHFAIYEPQPDDDVPVTFGDQNLKNGLINQGADCDSDGNLTCGEMRMMPWQINLNGGEISDLSGLEYAVNLRELSLSDNAFTDITPLSGLTSLTELDLSGNHISDLSALSGLTSLTRLDLSGNYISNLSTLSRLTGLTDLYLHRNSINNLAPLSGLTGLNTLGLFMNEISDVAPLSGLTGLTVLDLSDNQISDLSGLNGLTGLTDLFLDQNQISDITPLSGLTGLSYLYLNQNQISNITPLSTLTGLFTLDLSENQISDLSALSGLTNLCCLDLTANQISSISALGNLKSLGAYEGWLYLGDNDISDISTLSGLTQLSQLVLDNNPITDFEPLQTLTNLYSLSLAGVGLTDAGFLEDLTNMIYLDLSENQLTDISVLHGMAGLIVLLLSGNQIQDITVLKDFQELTVLNLSDNNIRDISALKNLPLLILDVTKNYLNLTMDYPDMNVIKSMLFSNDSLVISYTPQKELPAPPVITLAPFSTQPTNQNITVTATVNKGTLNAASHTFTQNGGFCFEATDEYDSKTFVTVVITNIDKIPPSVSGITNNAIYNINKTITFNEGTAMLNGSPFSSGGTVSADNNYTLVVTDAAGNSTTVSFKIDKTPPVITINPYNTAPTYSSVTVTASVNEGTLNATSHTFTQNGSFEFVATDAAGNRTTRTVTVTNIAAVTRGDVDGDGKKDGLDLLKLKKYLLSQVTLTDVERLAGDVDGDGKTDGLDLLKLKKYLLGQVSL